MITRIVKMKFKEEFRTEFISMFNVIEPEIKKFEGCKELKLLQDQVDENTLFTISTWKELNDLDNYRKSDFFKATWKKTKAMFQEKAEAWSLQ